MIFILIGITLVYLYLIGQLVFGFDKVTHFKFESLTPKTDFSVIIPFRNEEANLKNLLQSLTELRYPKNKFEVLLINDASTDASTNIINSFIDTHQISFKLIKNIRTTVSPKKDAITTGISKTKFNWIITTDADCSFNSKWLTTIDAFIQQKKPKMVVAPVAFIDDQGLLSKFQILDFLSLMGATIGGFGIQKPFLCNGANLIYSKALFYDVNGFKDNDTIASGDDIFLMEKAIKKYPRKVCYLKNEDATAYTYVEPSLASLIAQRKRWAAKTSSYSNTFGKLVGGIVLLMNFSLISGMLLSLYGVISFKNLGYLFLIKFCIDLWLLYKASAFFNQQKHLNYYIFSSLLYPFFNVYIALTSWFGGYHWKGRNFSK